MIDYPYLVPECNVDTVFVESLGYKRPNHADTISEVSIILEKHPHNRMIGFIDNDKKKTDYINQFTRIDSCGTARILKHPVRNHFLVVVNPAMDSFIFNLCTQLEIDIASYRFPSSLRPFTEATKRAAIRTNPKFKELLNTISQKKPHEIITIKKWIKTYSAYK